MSSRSSERVGVQTSRRDFLKTSTAAASAAMVGSLAVGRSAHAAGDEVLKVGLIGCGGRGSGAAAQAMTANQQNRLVAMADLFEDKVRGSRDRLKKMMPEQVAVDNDHCFTGFDGYKQVIEASDVVLIACASKFHPQYMKESVAAGKHVFVEKPHAIDPPGIRTVAAACEEAKKKNLAVVSGLCWRYHTGVQETMKRVLDGAIGDIMAIQETYMRTPYRLVERLPDQAELEYQCRNWYHFNWLSGDDIAQSLIHSMDKGSWALGNKPPLCAYGQGGRAASFGTVYGDVFDHHSIVYEYEGGVRMYAIGRAQNGVYNEVSDHFLGTKGRCNLLKFQIEGETNWRYEGPNCNMYELEHVALFDSIRAGKPLNNADYMVTSTMLGVLGEMVCYTGRKIDWTDAMAATYTLGPAECSFQMDPPVKPNADGTYPVAIPGMTKLG